jgi:ankyrin repeat protein
VHGVNAFWIAAYYNQFRILRMLSELGCERMCKNEIGSNALHIAVKRKNLESIEELIAMDFPLDIPRDNGVTALGIAVHSGEMRMVKLLVLARADVNFVSVMPNPGMSAMYLAVKHRNDHAIDYLL